MTGHYKNRRGILRGVILAKFALMLVLVICETSANAQQQYRKYSRSAQQQSARRPVAPNNGARPNYPVKPAAAQFSQNSPPQSIAGPGSVAGIAPANGHSQIPSINSVPIESLQLGPDTGLAFQTQASHLQTNQRQNFDGQEINRPLPKTATERALELAAENAQLREMLEQRNFENRTLQAEVTQSRQAIVAANHAVATTAEKIDRISQVLAERNYQIQQMQELIREHEAITSGRLKHLMSTIRRSLEARPVSVAPSHTPDKPQASGNTLLRLVEPEATNAGETGSTAAEASVPVESLPAPHETSTPSLKSPTARKPSAFSFTDERGLTR